MVIFPTKVLFITEEYPPLGSGVGTSARRVARNLKLLGCEILVVTFDCSRPLNDDDYTVSEIDGEVEVRRVGPFFHRHPSCQQENLPDVFRAVFLRRAFDQMEKIAAEFGPDVVLSFYAVHAGLLAAYLAQGMNVPHIACMRGNDVGLNIFSSNGLPNLRTIVESSAQIVCVNSYLQQRLLLAFPSAKDRTIVVQNSVELPNGVTKARVRQYLSSNTNWKNSDTICVFIGMLREKKGIKQLLDAVEAVSREAPLQLLVVGPEIADADRLQCGKAWQRLLAIGALHVTGNLDRASALRIAAEGDLVVMPSLEDGLANGLLEGMALGLCPIVSDIFSSVVTHKKSGWVVPRNDAKSLAGALLEATRSPTLRNEFTTAAQQRTLNEFSPLREAKDYFSLIEKTVGR